MEWTDKRMDDLAKRVDDGFKEVKGDISRLDAKIDGKIDGLRDEMKADFRHLDIKLNALLVATIVGVLSLIGAIGAAALGLIG
jgi:hypothetical protein